MHSSKDAEPTPRLIINSMVLENFKSYAGVREITPFHKCFSAVVGPNGSGKSNVIDALLFVFGKRANQIRLKTVSELIHSSDNHQNLQECKVSIHFHDIIDSKDDPEGYTVVPNSEIIITRTANKKNESKYYLNRKASNRTEVTTLLRAKGVDLDNNRFLILQGEVEQIAMMKPKSQNPNEVGILEYLEDIIGSNKYVEAIEESYAAVDKLTELRQEKLNRVKIVEKEKDTLEGAKSEAEECLIKERELHMKKADMYQVFLKDCNENLRTLGEQKTKLQESLDHENNKLKEHAERAKDVEVEYKQQSAAFDELKSTVAKAKKDFTAFERKDIKYREDMKHEKAKIRALKKKKTTLEKTTHDVTEMLRANEDNLPKTEKMLTQIIAEKEKEENVLDSIFEELKGKTEPIRIEMEQKQKELIPRRKKVNHFQQKLDVIHSEIKLFTERTETAQQQHVLATQEFASIEREQQESREKQKKLEELIHSQEKRLPQAQIELNEVLEQEKQTKQERQALRSRVEQTKASLEASKSENLVVTSLMGEKRAGRILGIQGRLGSLGAIDAKYDVAITTACPSLGNIVVDNTATGQKCVSFLRKNNLGRATFIMTDKMENLKTRMAQEIQTPENIPRLFDLIKCKDPALLPCFYYAVKDTLVAKDLDQAVRVSNHNGRRWRVVTLQGQLLEASGTMSGGGTKVMSGGMSSNLSSSSDTKLSKSEISRVEKDIFTAETELKKLATRRGALEVEVAQLTKSLKEGKLELRKLAMNLEELTKRSRQLQIRLADLKSQFSLTTAEENRIELLKKDGLREEKLLKEAEKDTETLQKAIQMLEKKIMDAGGERLRTQKELVDNLSKKLDATSKSMTKASVENKNLRNKLKKTDKELLTVCADLDESVNKEETLTKEWKAIETDALVVMKAYKECTAAMELKQKELSKLKADFEKMQTVVHTVELVKVDIVNKMNDFDRQIKDNANKASSMENNLSATQLKIRKNEKYLLSGDDEEHKEEAPEGVSGLEDISAPSAVEQNSKLRKYAMLTEGELEEVDRDGLQYEITMLEEAVQSMKPNMRAIAEYRAKEKEYATRVDQLDKTTTERDEARTVYDNLRKKRLDEFMSGFSLISMKLKEMYQMLTLGGDAELELVDTLDPFSEGIVFSVRPPKKSWKNIQNLSGGEKTLSSLALVFALHHYKPTPLYVMDEIDAALDFKNVSIVGNYIKERTKNAQFIIISLRNNMFELADRLVGIYKTDNATKTITIDPGQFTVPNASSLTG